MKKYFKKHKILYINCGVLAISLYAAVTTKIRRLYDILVHNT